MKKSEFKELIDYAAEHIRKIIYLWHEKSLEQIRLESANKRRIEEYKYNAIMETRRK